MSPRSVGTRHLNDSNANTSEKNTDDYDQIDTDKLISANDNHNSSFKQQQHQQLNLVKIEPVISLLVCQIISLEESRIFKFLTNKFETILDFDFYTHNGRRSSIV